MKVTNILSAVGIGAMIAIAGPGADAFAADEAKASSKQAQEAEESREARVARGAQYWAQHCKRCHNLRRVNELTDSEWEVAVTHMQVRASLPGQIARDVKLYLKSSN